MSFLISPLTSGNGSRHWIVRSWHWASLALTQDLLPSAQNVEEATSEVHVLKWKKRTFSYNLALESQTQINKWAPFKLGKVLKFGEVKAPRATVYVFIKERNASDHPLLVHSMSIFVRNAASARSKYQFGFVHCNVTNVPFSGDAKNCG